MLNSIVMESSTGIYSTQHTDNATDNSAHYKGSLEITLWYCVSGIATCFLNTVCAAAILRGKLHKEENRFLFMASLAVTDSLFGFTFFSSAVILSVVDSLLVCYISSILREATAVADVLCLCLLNSGPVHAD